MELEEQFKQIKESMANDRTLKEGAIRTVVANYTSDDADAVADKNVKEWMQDNLSKWAAAPDKPIQVNFATATMFAHLRIALKQGEIAELKLSVNGKIYDIIFPNGKLFGIMAPDGLDIYENALFELL